MAHWLLLTILIPALPASAAPSCVSVELPVPAAYRLVNAPVNPRMRECIAFGQESSFKFATVRDARFASCAGPLAAPARGAGKPCPGAQYIDSIKLLLESTAYCMGIEDVRHFLPKFAGESGFYHNALGKSLDAGLGQLTPIALQETAKHASKYRKQWAAHADEGCRELSRRNELWADVSGKSACVVMARNWGPARNILHAFILASTEAHRLERLLLRNEIEAKLARLGMREAGAANRKEPWQLPKNIYRRQDLTGALSTVAYNSGATEVVKWLSAYLDQRITARAPLNKDHFNFKDDLSRLDTLRVPPKASEVSFPEFIKLHQRIGQPGYGASLMRWVYRYNEGVAPGICAPDRIEGFLSL